MRIFSFIILICVILMIGVVFGFFVYHETYIPIIKNIINTNSSKTVDLRPFIMNEQDNVFSSKNLKEKNNNTLFGIAIPKKTGALYDLTDIIGYAVSVTSDGWLLTSYEINKIRDVVVLTPENTVLPITDIQKDPLTGLLMIKVDYITNNAVQTASADSFVEGDVYYRLGFVFDDMAIEPLYLSERKSNHTIDPYTTEKVENRYGSRFIANIMPGTPVVNKKGLVVGIKGEKDDDIIPSDYIDLTINHFLKNKSFTQRAHVNASFLDISYIGGEYNNINKLFNGEKKGAYVVSFSNKKEPNANKNNTQKIELLKGDIILSIDGILIDKKYDISEILGTYKKGDTIKIKIKRGDKTLENSIIL